MACEDIWSRCTMFAIVVRAVSGTRDDAEFETVRVREFAPWASRCAVEGPLLAGWALPLLFSPGGMSRALLLLPGPGICIVFSDWTAIGLSNGLPAFHESGRGGI